MKSKADLHIHSKYSDQPANWILRKFGCSESFTEPVEIYNAAKKAGMNFVTITDHNEIKGCLDILDYPNTFISCEFTTRFPEDECKFHLLVYDFTEAQYSDMMKLRHNIYDMREYLNHNNIFHSVAHAFYSVNNKLTKEAFEKLLVLFNTFELCESIESILNKLTPEKITELANKYDITPIGQVWEKTYTSGSDDHTGLKIATKYTETLESSTPREFLENIINKGIFEEKGVNLAPRGFAHNMYSIGYQFYANRFELEKYVTKDTSLKIIDRLLLGKQRDEDLISKFISNIRDTRVWAMEHDNSKLLSNSLIKIINKNMVTKHKDIIKNVTPENISDKWFEVANSNINNGLSHLINYIIGTAKNGNVFDIFHTLGSAGSLYFLVAPYFFAYHDFEKIKLFASEVSDKQPETKVIHFSDTFYDVNGVAKTLQQNLKTARKTCKNYTIATCAHPTSKILDEKVFEPVGQYEMPTYSDLSCYYPPFLEMLDYCYNENFTHIHTATPGLVGLAALGISKILKKPIYGTYHTAFPQYLSHLTDDPGLESVTWRYMVWYYNQLDIVFVPSNAMKKELESKGIDSRKLKLYPRGVDTQRFRPTMPKNQDVFKLLYVGRVSKEKNLHLLGQAFKRLSTENSNLILQIVGEGPYKDEMSAYMKGTNVEFLGYKQGDELIDLYSGADLFVFPSTTDTFGNVVLEAQACGTPVIVTDGGGPMENIIPNQTGIIIRGNSEETIYQGIKSLLNKEKLDNMSKQAYEYMKNRSFEDAFLENWEFYNLKQEINHGTEPALV